jgi:DNA mismatch endonuclease, patch repair protein
MIAAVLTLRHLTTTARSRVMSSIRKTDTSPEMAVRRIVHQLGFRYRLHARDLPGTPDIVLPRLKKIVMVHGCFWHQHDGCRLAKRPRARPEYWLPKLARNKARDEAAERALVDLGWDVLVIWECQVNKPECVRATLLTFLGSRP